MKNYFRLGLLVFVAALASCGSSQRDGSGADMQSMDHGGKKSEMAGMDHGSMGSGGMAREMVMENGKYSDERFIDAMVPHHQGAIEMAKVALKNAEHEEISSLAENIVATQQAEIEKLKSIKQEEFGTSKVPMDMNSREMDMMGMMNPQQLAKQRPFDRAFIDAMIPHHQSAIEMAQIASEKSDNPKIKELAKNIVSAQQKEIEQMRQWREEWYPDG